MAKRLALELESGYTLRGPNFQVYPEQGVAIAAIWEDRMNRLWRAVSVLALLWLGFGCNSDDAVTRAHQVIPVDTADEEAPAPLYYPEDNLMGNPAALRVVTEEELAARQQARYEAAQHRRSAAGWLERIAPYVSAQTTVIVGRFVEDLGAEYGVDSHTARVEVLEYLAGEPPSAALIEVVQDAIHGQPWTSGGLHWNVGLVVALVLEPEPTLVSELDVGVYRLLAPTTIAETGWALATGEDEFTAYGGVVLNRDELATITSLGGTP